MEFVTIGRHEFTPIQKEILEKVGLDKEVGRIGMINDINKAIETIRNYGIKHVVVQGLPIHILGALLSRLPDVNFYMFVTEPVGVFETEEEASKHGDIVIPSRDDGYRVLKTVGLERVLRVEVVKERII